MALSVKIFVGVLTFFLIMDALIVQDLMKETCLLILKVGAPVLLVSLAVGFVISLLQALTQVQEMTISFVPKLIAILVTLILSASFMGNMLTKFTQKLFDKITVTSS